jgi:hypothetical protein
MKTLTKWMLAVLAATAAVGCDPFEEAVGGPPVVIAAGFTDTENAVGYTATATGSAWTVSNVASICGVNTPGVPELPGFIFVKFNKLLDGASIQTSPTDCRAVAALNLAVTYNGSATPPPGTDWYACYNPQAPSPDEGASVIVFLGDAAVPPVGWIDAVPIPTSATAVTTVQATGTVHDKEGAATSFDVTANLDPDPGVPGRPTFTNITTTSVTVNWDPPCDTTTTYDVQRAPDVAGAPGTFANVATGLTVLTFVNAGLTTATPYWYRVIAHRAAAADLISAAASVTPLAAPAAPTFNPVAATSVTVNWTAVTGATGYIVQRAPDVAGAPGTFANRNNTPVTGTTYADPTVAATTYWYRVLAVAADGTRVPGASATVTTP